MNCKQRHLILSTSHVDSESTATPSDGDHLEWDDALELWTPKPPAAGGLTHAPIGGYFPGVLSMGIKTTPQTVYEGDDFTLTKLRCRLAVAGAGADVKVKIRRNGTSMGEVNLGTTQDGTVTGLTVAVSAGDYFDIEITGIGSSPNQGSDLVWLGAP